MSMVTSTVVVPVPIGDISLDALDENSDHPPDLEAGVVEEKPKSDNLCVVCLTADVEIMLLPCRHAVLCQECAKRVRRGNMESLPKCPLCRSKIEGVVVGRFLQDYVKILANVEGNLERVQAAVYDTMYNHVRIFMSIGVLAACGAVGCFMALPAPLSLATGIGCACGAVAFGYLPWFLATAQAFEKEDGGTGVNSQLVSHEDLSHPLTLATKAVVLLIGIPVAVAVFFVPYAAFRFLLRPVLRVLFRCGLRCSVGTAAYVVIPAVRCVRRAPSFFAETIECCCSAACLATCCIGEICCEVISVSADCSEKYVLRPTWCAITVIGGLILCCIEMVAYILSPIIGGLCWTCVMTVEYVLKPIVKGFCWLMTKSTEVFCDALQDAGDVCCFGSMICCCACCLRMGDCLEAIGPCLIYLYDGISFILMAISMVFVSLFKVIEFGFYCLYICLLLPLGKCISFCCRVAYVYLILPLGRLVTFIFKAVGQALLFLFAGIAKVLSFVVTGIWSIVAAAASAIWAAACMTASAIAAVTSFVGAVLSSISRMFRH